MTIGEGTPRKAPRGRAPLMLRDFDRSGVQERDDDDDDARLSAFRHAQRLREIAATSIIEATAQVKMGRAAKARTAPPIEDLKLDVGDLVDFFKPGKPPKDVPKGPRM